MKIVLVHHAEAVDPAADAQRPLSPHGRAQAEQLAVRAAERGILPAVIWHSGKLRSRQTAEAFWRTCNPFAGFVMVKGLRPEDSPDVARTQIDLEDRDLLLVSHMPMLPALARALSRGIESFPMNGLIVLERTAPGTYVERWRDAPDVQSA
jgi:phosphohistidine phosphatase